MSFVSLHSQSANNQAWIEYMLNYPFRNSFNVEFAPTYSKLFGSNEWHQLSLQVTPEWAVSYRLDLMGAAMISRTKQNDVRITDEVRGMLGARVHFTPNNRILTRLLVRFEHRNLQNIDDKTWGISNRTRIRAETVTPLNKKSMYAGDNLWYLIVDGEIFVVMEQNVQERYANRYRIRVGLGYRVSYGLRLEFMYNYQEARNTIDAPFTTQDALFRFRIKQYLHHAKPAKAEGPGD